MNEYPNLENLAICRENVAKTYLTYLNYWVDSEFSVSIFIQLLFQADIPTLLKKPWKKSATKC